MKKTLILFAILVAAVIGAQARDYSTTNVSVLPAKAQTYLKTNFKAKVNHINVDKSITGSAKDFEVILADGTEIDFDADGNMKEVDCGMRAVPASIVPKAVAQYVKTNYRNGKITCIEMKRNKMEVKLSNGTELEFDRAGRFLRAD